MSVVGTLLKKELTDSLRDRRTLLLMILVPMFLYPGTLALLGFVTTAGKERLAREPLRVGLTSEAAGALLAKREPPYTSFERVDRAAGEARLKERELAAILDAPEDTLATLSRGGQASVTLLYTKRFDRSIEARERMIKALHGAGVAVLVQRLESASLPSTFAEPLKTDEVDVDFQKNLGPLIASRMLPMVLLVMLFMGAIYPALDTTAGEKERGTLETLLVAPVRPLEVMLAKYLTVALVSTLASLVNLAAMGLTFYFGIQLGGPTPIQLTLSAGQILTLLVCLVPAAFMVSGVVLVVASLARNFKEGQNLLTPVMIVATVPGILALMPGVELNAGTALLPLVNVALLVKATLLGTAQPLHVALTVASIAATSAITLALAANAFQSEALRFGGTESWRDLFRFRG